MTPQTEMPTRSPPETSVKFYSGWSLNRPNGSMTSNAWTAQSVLEREDAALPERERLADTVVENIEISQLMYMRMPHERVRSTGWSS